MRPAGRATFTFTARGQALRHRPLTKPKENSEPNKGNSSGGEVEEDLNEIESKVAFY